MNELKILKEYEKEGFKLISAGLDNEQNLKEFNFLSQKICNFNNPFMAYSFAERFSAFCIENEKYMKALKFNQLQKIVLNSNDEELMYLFGDRVVGCDLKLITCAMPKGSLRTKLEKNMQPIDEYNF